MQNIKIFDSTERDGQHAIRHQITKSQIKNYAKLVEKTGIYALVVGHGNGLGASSIHLGRSSLGDRQMLTTARRELKSTKLCAFVLPGFATLKDMDMAIAEGVDIFQIASHCTEATVTKQYIEYAKRKGKEVYGVLMMSHMLEGSELQKQAYTMKNYGVDGVFLMDSAGALLPDDVGDRVCYMRAPASVGFHPHNNLGLAVANAIAAVESGASMIDGTTRGLGAGAGNCPLEVLVPVLHKMGYSTGINVERLFDCADYIASQFPPQDLTPLSITSGLEGVFSGFKPHVLKAAKKYKVNPHEVMRRLGKEKVVAGQEDQILQVAKDLKTNPMEALS